MSRSRLVGLKAKASIEPLMVWRDGHVGGDGAVRRVQGGNHGLLLAVRPERQILECPRRHNCRVQHIGSGAGRHGARAVHDAHRKLTLELMALPGIARVEHTARRKVVQRHGIRRRIRGREVAVDVDEQVCAIAVGIRLDSAPGPCRHDSRVGRDGPSGSVEG